MKGSAEFYESQAVDAIKSCEATTPGEPFFAGAMGMAQAYATLALTAATTAQTEFLRGQATS